MRNLRKYISQSWQILKQNKLYSFFYILGTALAISMVMVLAIGYNLKVGSIYPEVNRDRIMVLSTLKHMDKRGGGGIESFSENGIQKLLAGVEGIESICISQRYSSLRDVQKNVSSEIKKKQVAYYNEEVWRVHQFYFIDGRPFTKEDVENYNPIAVISASTAKSIFGDEQAVGEKIWIDYKEFTICGIVKDVSPLVHTSYADIYLPYTHSDAPHRWNSKTSIRGTLSALILAKSSKDFDKIKAQVEENLAKIESTLDEVELSLFGAPYSYLEENLAMDIYDEAKDDSASKHILQLIIVVLVIIMVPTFNISGIISTEMEDREAEVGIRKAFGAPRWRLLYSLINENLVLSFIGGILGILLSYLFIYIGYQWFLSFFVTDSSTLPWLNMEMLINYKVIIIVFISCILMNLLSSIIPQYFSTKKNIITLLKRNSNVRGGKSPKLKSVWIFMELLAVFVIAWMAIDPLYVLNYQKSIYDGFDHKDLYIVSIPSISKKSPAYKQETKEEKNQYSKIILGIIKNHPLVESAVLGYNMPIDPSYYSTADLRIGSGDSLRISANRFEIPADKNYFSAQGIRIPEKLDEANFHAGNMLISKSVAEKLFGEDEAVGKKLVGRNIIGVVDDIKTIQYEQPIPTVINIVDSRQMHLVHMGMISFLIKAKPDISEGKFIKTFTEDLADKFKMGNRYFDRIYPYSERIEDSNSQITQQKSVYAILAYFVLFNMFLGIFATFWLQSKKRRAEIGLRMAMGSSKRKVSRMFVMESIKMASIAALVGMIVVGNIVYFKGMFTYGEWQSPTYWPVTNWAAHFIIVSLIAYAVIILTVTLGTLIPASKAANTNPVDALRDE